MAIFFQSRQKKKTKVLTGSCELMYKMQNITFKILFRTQRNDFEKEHIDTQIHFLPCIPLKLNPGN